MKYKIKTLYQTNITTSTVAYHFCNQILSPLTSLAISLWCNRLKNSLEDKLSLSNEFGPHLGLYIL